MNTVLDIWLSLRRQHSGHPPVSGADMARLAGLSPPQRASACPALGTYSSRWTSLAHIVGQYRAESTLHCKNRTRAGSGRTPENPRVGSSILSLATIQISTLRKRSDRPRGRCFRFVSIFALSPRGPDVPTRTRSRPASTANSPASPNRLRSWEAAPHSESAVFGCSLRWGDNRPRMLGQ